MNLDNMPSQGTCRVCSRPDQPYIGTFVTSEQKLRGVCHDCAAAISQMFALAVINDTLGPQGECDHFHKGDGENIADGVAEAMRELFKKD